MLLTRQQDLDNLIWNDDNRNLLADAGEVRSFVAPNGIVALATDENGCTAFVGANGESEPVFLWHDADCDLGDDAVEKGMLDLASAGSVRTSSAHLGFYGGHVALVFREQDTQETRIVAWADLDDDRLVDAEEYGVIARAPGQQSASLVSVDANPLAVRYSVDGAWYVWNPTFPWMVGETRPLEWPSCEVYRVFRRDTQDSWANVNACANGDGVLVNGRSSIPFRQAYRTALTVGADETGRSYVLMLTSSESVVWIDRNRDGLVAQDELVVRALAAVVNNPRSVYGAVIDGAPIFVGQPDDFSGVSIERWWSLENTRYLGEPCEVSVNYCVDGLACRTSGEAVEPRCVPVVE